MSHVGRGRVRLGEALAVILVALAAVWVPSAGGQETVTLTYASYGGAFKDAAGKTFFEPHMKIHPNNKGPYHNLYPRKVSRMVEGKHLTWEGAPTGKDRW